MDEAVPVRVRTFLASSAGLAVFFLKDLERTIFYVLLSRSEGLRLSVIRVVNLNFLICSGVHGRPIYAAVPNCSSVVWGGYSFMFSFSLSYFCIVVLVP